MMKLNTLGVLAAVAACLCAPPTWSADLRDAPAFSVASDTGNLRLADFKGKVVYIDFFASWCGPCRSSFKWLNDTHDKHAANGLVILAINVDKERDLAAQFLKQNPARFRVGYDAEGSIAQLYQLKGMPSSYLIDRKGQLRAIHIGFRDKDRVARADEITSLLAE